MTTPSTPTTPAAAAERELVAERLTYDLHYAVTMDWDEFLRQLEHHPGWQADVNRARQALLSARQAQLEDDCAVICFSCKTGHAVELVGGDWLHVGAMFTCAAAPIRAQAAALKAVSEKGAGKGEK